MIYVQLQNIPTYTIAHLCKVYFLISFSTKPFMREAIFVVNFVGRDYVSILMMIRMGILRIETWMMMVMIVSKAILTYPRQR